jgi:hypothetical protein
MKEIVENYEVVSVVKYKRHGCPQHVNCGICSIGKQPGLIILERFFSSEGKMKTSIILGFPIG